MGQKLTASMPENLDLEANWQIIMAAVDPVSGAAVSGVTFSNMNLVVDQLSDSPPTALVEGPFMLVPGPND